MSSFKFPSHFVSINEPAIRVWSSVFFYTCKATERSRFSSDSFHTSPSLFSLFIFIQPVAVTRLSVSDPLPTINSGNKIK